MPLKLKTLSESRLKGGSGVVRGDGGPRLTLRAPFLPVAGPRSERIRCCGGWFSNGASRCSCWAIRCPPAGARWRSSAADCKCPILPRAPGEGWGGQGERSPGWGAAEGPPRSWMLLARVIERRDPLPARSWARSSKPAGGLGKTSAGDRQETTFMCFHERERFTDSPLAKVLLLREKGYFQNLGRFWNPEDCKKLKVTRRKLRCPGGIRLCVCTCIRTYWMWVAGFVWKAKTLHLILLWMT